MEKPNQSLKTKGRPQWLHYFREFLMLFFAVFCGFLAEYQLEHKLEEEEEREYVLSLREDLCKDTVIIRKFQTNLHRFVLLGDSLISIIQEEDFQSAEKVKQLYYFNSIALGGFSVILTDRTESQLKNSGGMRLISKKPVVDGILDYWNSKTELKAIEKTALELRIKAREKSYSIFNHKYYSHNVHSKSIPELMDCRESDIVEFGNRVAHYIYMLNVPLQNFLINQKIKADSLIRVIDREYPSQYKVF